MFLLSTPPLRDVNSTNLSIVCYFSLKMHVCFLSASLIQTHLLTMASARELKPVKYLELFKIYVPY